MDDCFYLSLSNISLSLYKHNIIYTTSHIFKTKDNVGSLVKICLAQCQSLYPGTLLQSFISLSPGFTELLLYYSPGRRLRLVFLEEMLKGRFRKKLFFCATSGQSVTFSTNNMLMYEVAKCVSFIELKKDDFTRIVHYNMFLCKK